MSLPAFAVSEAKNSWLRERMSALGVREEDIAESFIRSSGKGGQHVNKTSSCVYLRHLPTGLEVKCGTDRSQSVNRFLARRELLEKIAHLRGETTPRDKEMVLLLRESKKERGQSRNTGQEMRKSDDSKEMVRTLEFDRFAGNCPLLPWRVADAVRHLPSGRYDRRVSGWWKRFVR
jgi:protein subunit release factor B